MHDVITIGSSLVDLFVSSTDFTLKTENQQVMLCQQYGDKIEVDRFTVTIGGGGNNTAVGFTRLGFRTAVVSELGVDAWSQLIMTQLEQEKVDISLLITEKKEQTGGSVILVSPEGGRTVMVYRGAASQLDAQDIPEHALMQASWVHISSIAGRQAALQKIFSVLSTYKTRFSWNPGKAEIALLVSGELRVEGLHCLVFIVNQEEWELLEPIHDQLHQMARQIVVTKGRAGGEVFENGQAVHQYSIDNVQAVDETGAGDSFGVGYITGVLLGKPIAECVVLGKRNAASVVQHFGATKGLLTRDQLLQ